MDFPNSDVSVRLHNGEFTDGIPGLGVPSSIDKAESMNVVYREMVNLIIALAGTPTENQHNQLATLVPGFINQRIEALRGTVGTALDTLQEIATALGNDPSFATNVYAAIGNRAPSNHTHTPSQVGLSNIPNSVSQTITNNANTLVSGAALYNYSQIVTAVLAGKATVPQQNLLASTGGVRFPDINLGIKWGTVPLTAAAGAATYLGTVIFPEAFNQLYGAGMFLLSMDGSADYYAAISTYNQQYNGFSWKLRKETVNGTWHAFYIALGVDA